MPPISKQWPRVQWVAGKNAWMVDARIGGSGSRTYHRDKPDKDGRMVKGRDWANDWAEQLRGERAKRGEFGIIQAGEELAKYGKTINDAVNYYLGYLASQAKSIKIEKCIEQFHEARKTAGLSKRYLLDLKMRLSTFEDSFPDLLMAEVTTKAVDEWLDGLQTEGDEKKGKQARPLAAWTRNTFRRDVRTLFSFAVKRGYCSTNPVEATQRVKSVDKPVEILTPEEVETLLTKCPDDMVPYFALGCFAGLRSAELAKLDWKEIRLDEGHLEVTAAKAKTRRRRLVDLSPNLIAWLRPHAKESGKVAVGDLPRKLRPAYRKAGYGKPGTETPKEKTDGLVIRRPWPTNCMRHSFGSYHLAKHKDAARLALLMGNSPQVIFAHYREVVRPADAERYWAIVPKVKK
jgi:integrase